MTRVIIITRYMVVLLGLVYSSPSDSAFAAEIKVYPDAGPDRYYNNNSLPSACAGNPTTPQCALDTWQSCNSKGHSDHCEAIGIDGKVYRPPLAGYKSPLIYLAYRPIKLVVIEEGDIPSHSRLDQWLNIGDIEVTYDFHNCDGDQPSDCNWQENGEKNLFFRKVGAFWHLIAWTAAVGYVFCEGYEQPYDRQCDFWLDDSLYVEYVGIIDPNRKTDLRGFMGISPALPMQTKKP